VRNRDTKEEERYVNEKYFVCYRPVVEEERRSCRIEEKREKKKKFGKRKKKSLKV